MSIIGDSMVSSSILVYNYYWYNASSKCTVVRRGANNLIVPRATGLYMNLVLVLSLVR